MQAKPAVPLSVGSTDDAKTAMERWAQHLKQGFRFDNETRSECGYAVKVIARIEGSVVCDKMLTRLIEKAVSLGTGLMPEDQAVPQPS